MSSLLEGNEEQLERELVGEPFAKPATGSIVLHALLTLAIVLYYILGGFFHSNLWGGSAAGGAIRVNITSALPLPSDRPINENVLATEKPSPAPEIAQPKEQAKTIDMTAVPIPGKKEKVKPQPAPKSPPKQQQVAQDNRARYGEQAGSSMPRAITGQTMPGPTSVGEGDFGSRFPWYVDSINRAMSQVWNKGEVDARTPKGTRSNIHFTIAKDGTVKDDVRIDKSSGSFTLDKSCQRAAQRLGRLQPLPNGYAGSTLDVFYYCEY